MPPETSGGAGGFPGMRPTVLVAFIVLAVPTALASWNVHGSVEPDTPQDTEGGYNHFTPDTRPDGQRVYFNAVPIQGGVDFIQAGRVDPNAAPGMRVAPLSLQFRVFLGVWKDCDKDGYVGTAAGALMEYKSELLEKDDVCADGSIFNRDGWVVEFLWLTPKALHTGERPMRHIRDDDVGVWGDVGAPGAPPFYRCGLLSLVARGNLATTGEFLRMADCWLGHGVGTALGEPPASALGLAFDDPYHPEEDCDHPLNQPVSPYGTTDKCHPDHPGTLENGGEPAFTVYDCDTRAIDPRVGDPRDSWYQGLVSLQDALYSPIPKPAEGVNPPRACDPSSPSALGILQVPRIAGFDEPGTHGDPRDPKAHHDFQVRFQGFGAEEMKYYVAALEGPGRSVLGRAPASLGVEARNTHQGMGWISETMLPGDYRGGTTRDGLEPASAWWFTFYARVGSATTAVATTPGTTGAYGAEACGGQRSGARNQWDCNADHWRKGDVPSVWFPRPGDGYQFRDVDCLDGTLTTALDPYDLPRPKASLADVSGQPPCPSM